MVKDKVSFLYRLASIVYPPIVVNFSYFHLSVNLLKQMEPNLVVMILGEGRFRFVQMMWIPHGGGPSRGSKRGELK